jgi:hypothetical protein
LTQLFPFSNGAHEIRTAILLENRISRAIIRIRESYLRQCAHCVRFFPETSICFFANLLILFLGDFSAFQPLLVNVSGEFYVYLAMQATCSDLLDRDWVASFAGMG